MNHKNDDDYTHGGEIGPDLLGAIFFSSLFPPSFFPTKEVFFSPKKGVTTNKLFFFFWLFFWYLPPQKRGRGGVQARSANGEPRYEFFGPRIVFS
jgi:hypothetical protein